MGARVDKTGVSRNFLDDKQKFKLCMYLHANEERLKQDRPAYDAVAEQASKKLGFSVSTRNVITASGASGVTWEAPKHSRAALYKKVAGRVGDLEARVEELEGIVHRICTELGVRREPTANGQPPPGR